VIRVSILLNVKVYLNKKKQTNTQFVQVAHVVPYFNVSPKRYLFFRLNRQNSVGVIKVVSLSIGVI